jgi:hypothetical protein
MMLLVLAGLLYLAGISVILILKPELMFTKDGNWKEFGIGRNKNRYTWMPFWLFAITWAILSYIIILVTASIFEIAGVKRKTDIPVSVESIEPENISVTSTLTSIPKKKITHTTSSNDMKSGYYILDTNETIKRGIPKYIYLGPEAPNVIYNSSITESE